MNVNEMLAARRRKQRMARFSKSVASGDQARAARDWQNAATRYREALELNPHAAPIWVQLGHAVKAQGSYAQAEAAYRRAVAENGSDADAHLQLGHVLKLQGKYRDAADAYRAASRADPALADADRELEAIKDSPSAPDAVQAMLHDLQARTDRLAEASQDLRARTDRLADASQAAALVQFRAIDGIDAKVKNALRQEFDVGLSGPSLFADALGGLWDNFGQLHAQVQGVVEGLHSRGDWPALEQRLTVVDGNIADLAARITGEAARTTGEADRFRGELDALIGSKTAAAVAEQMSAQTARRDELEDVRSRVEFIRRELLYEFRSAVLDTGQPKAPPVTSKVLNATKVVQALGSGMLRLNIGCGHVSEDQYVNVDVRELPGVDVIADVTDLPFDDEAASEIYSAHLLEHFPEEILRRVVLPHWRKKLRAGGLLRTIVPDAGAMIKDYLDGEMPFQDLRDVTFGGQDYGGDFHFTMFTCDHIRNLLHDLGFEELIVTAQGRKNGTCRELEIVGVRGK